MYVLPGIYINQTKTLMPTYEYKREDGSVFELRQSIKENPLETCPETGQRVKRMISGGGGVVYKGEGWYVTDYKKSNDQPPANGKPDSPDMKNKADSNSTKTNGDTAAASD